ncbi:hypothetical protein DICVIV_08488 [Dictyocaulus viviparus]|uniref:Uncharacterized protein n=1 Tax=Dictyocaulus viviparus TaxID=29172 RepID=A0A0D8XLR5_DICVI|nr:hypothetical protein DICVIV_08488 [Dictyocaulus viviparus]
MFPILLPLLLTCTITALPGRYRRDTEAPRAHGLNSVLSEIRKSPTTFLQSIGPLAVGKRDGDDAKVMLPGLGTFGVGDVKSSFAKFIPAGMGNQIPNGGTFNIADKPNLGYMEMDTTAGKTSGSTSKISLGGIGAIQVGQEKEQGSGLLDFSKTMFPFLQLPVLKSDKTSDNFETPAAPELADVFHSKPTPGVQENEGIFEMNPLPARLPDSEFREILAKKETTFSNPFNRIRIRPEYKEQSRVHGAKTLTEIEDIDLLPTAKEEEHEGFLHQSAEEALHSSGATVSSQHNMDETGGHVLLSELGLPKKEIYALCLKFAPIAAKHCYVPEVGEQYIDKCRGYKSDCAQFFAQERPLGAIANAFSSGVGLTYYNWDVNGIPYYPVNEEGSIGNGHNGKIDFGSWGGGYSDNLGVRDYWSQTQEYGANWYEGNYGFKNGWSIPLVQSAGVEGGGGTQVCSLITPVFRTFFDI